MNRDIYPECLTTVLSIQEDTLCDDWWSLQYLQTALKMFLMGILNELSLASTSNIKVHWQYFWKTMIQKHREQLFFSSAFIVSKDSHLRLVIWVMFSVVAILYMQAISIAVVIQGCSVSNVSQPPTSSTWVSDFRLVRQIMNEYSSFFYLVNLLSSQSNFLIVSFHL